MTDPRLARAIEQAMGQLLPPAEVTSIAPLTGGSSALILGVELGDGRRVVVRQHRSADFKGHDAAVCATEFGVLQELGARGFPVPAALLLDDSRTMTDPFMVLEFVDGTTEVAGDEVATAMVQMAEFLVRLHEMDTASFAVDGLRRGTGDPIAALFRWLPTEGLGADLRAAAAAGRIAFVPNDLVIVHGDYWPGNVMWSKGRLVAVIDWEDTHAGEPLADLACARGELYCRYGAETMALFTDEYVRRRCAVNERLRVDSLAFWEVLSSAGALATMASWGLEPAEEAHRRVGTEAFFNRAATELLESS